MTKLDELKSWVGSRMSLKGLGKVAAAGVALDVGVLALSAFMAGAPLASPAAELNSRQQGFASAAQVSTVTAMEAEVKEMQDDAGDFLEFVATNPKYTDMLGKKVFNAQQKAWWVSDKLAEDLKEFDLKNKLKGYSVNALITDGTVNQLGSNPKLQERVERIKSSVETINSSLTQLYADVQSPTGAIVSAEGLKSKLKDVHAKLDARLASLDAKLSQEGLSGPKTPATLPK